MFSPFAEWGVYFHLLKPREWRLMSANWILTTRFGELEISDPTITANVSHAADRPYLTAELVVPDELLTAANPDYQAEVQISASDGTDSHVMFTGYVDRVLPEEGGTRICLVTRSRFASEVSVGGFGYKNVHAGEIIWTMARYIGFPSKDITVEAWTPGPTELFEVAVAVDGISVDRPVALGEVTLLPDGTASRLADGMKPDELRERYAEGPVWALVFIKAETLLEAEREGVGKINLALAWLTARTRYSSASLPEGALHAFKRHWTLSRMSPRNVVVVRGLSTNRRWLRALRGAPINPQVAAGEIKGLESPALPSEVPMQVAVAISAWQRAAEAADPVEALVALWEAIEFYVSGTKGEKLFTTSEVRTICERTTEGFSNDKERRVEQVLRMLNQAPLMKRLREALEEDGVPYSNEEFDLLHRVRTKRNDLHGRSRQAPSEEDLKYAVSIVNRMLVYRVARLNEADIATQGSRG